MLARLLDPGDFGLMAMALTLFAFFGSLSDFGLPHAVVHAERFDPRHAAGLFRLNRRLILGLALILAASGPLVAWFYGRSEIVLLSVAIAGFVGLGGVLNLHVAVMRRQMRFGVLSLGAALGLLLGTVAAIGMAWAGAGVWALVVQAAGQQTGAQIAAWFASGWRPTRERQPLYDESDAAGVRRYARDVAAARVVANVGRNLDRALVGGLAGAAATGLYQQSYKCSVLPVQQVHQPILAVAVSALSRLGRGDVGRYRSAVRRALLLVLSVTMPAAVLLMIEADSAVRLLLGTDWLGAVPLLRVLAAAAFITGQTQATKWVYLAEGQTRRQLWWSLLYAPLNISFLLAGALLGRAHLDDVALGTAFGFTAGAWALAWPAVWWATRGTRLRAVDLWRPAWRPAAASVLAGLALIGLPPFLIDSPLRLFASAPIFGGFYAAAWLVLPGGVRALREALDVAALLRGGGKA